MESKPAKGQRGIQSVEIAGQVLIEMSKLKKAIGLSELAKSLSMPAPKLHPYLVSLSKVGLTAQNPSTGHYSLGPTSIQMGLTSLQMLDPIREARHIAEELVADIGYGVSFSVPGIHGPVVVRVINPDHHLYIVISVGSIMSLRNTSTGRTFAAYMPAKTVENMLQNESFRVGGQSPHPLTDKQLEQELIDIRKHGISRGIDHPTIGVSSLAAPVFDHEGNIVMALTVFGPSNNFDTNFSGPISLKLLKATHLLSQRLGAPELAVTA